jgi:hypothetical protein
MDHKSQQQEWCRAGTARDGDCTCCQHGMKWHFDNEVYGVDMQLTLVVPHVDAAPENLHTDVAC